MLRNASAATCASTDAPPAPCSSSAARIAPAPMKSSTHGRSGPKNCSDLVVLMSIPHRSPAGIRPMGRPSAISSATRATAPALRRHPASTAAPVLSANVHSVAPFGEGRSST